MKLSELTYREYIALEVLPAVVSRGVAPSVAQVRHSFEIADAFLDAVGKADRRVQQLTERAEKAERAHEMGLNMNEDGQFAARVALSEIWIALGVDNQTAAMQAVKSFRPEKAFEK